MKQVVGWGALNMDRIIRVERILVDGEAAILEQLPPLPGGSAANTIAALARLGVKTGFLGAVGDDEGGGMLLDDFRSHGVDVSHIAVKNGWPTGAVLCLSDREGNRSLYVSPGANELLAVADVDLEYLAEAEVVHLSSLSGSPQLQQQKAAVAALSDRVKVSFAPGALYVRWGWTELAPILERCHFLFLNQDEITALTGQGLEAGARRCLEAGCQQVTVTLGAGIQVPGSSIPKGAYIATRDSQFFLDILPSPAGPVEATGAGDAFAAGFLFGYLNGRDLLSCGRLGMALAHLALSRPGARVGLPTLSQLNSYLDSLPS
ncbi:MAG: carbohydrate kinase family protein [Chloroflexi bacterium]|nr:carbohydrate kinase family protein [Chloroflexota bacterium]